MKKKIENLLAWGMFKLARSNRLGNIFPNIADTTTNICSRVSVRCYRRNLSLHYIVYAA